MFNMTVVHKFKYSADLYNRIRIAVLEMTAYFWKVHLYGGDGTWKFSHFPEGKSDELFLITISWKCFHCNYHIMWKRISPPNEHMENFFYNQLNLMFYKMFSENCQNFPPTLQKRRKTFLIFPSWKNWLYPSRASHIRDYNNFYYGTNFFICSHLLTRVPF